MQHTVLNIGTVVIHELNRTPELKLKMEPSVVTIKRKQFPHILLEGVSTRLLMFDGGIQRGY